MLKYPEPKSKAFMLSGENVKLVICTKRASYDACLTVEGVTYKDFFNDAADENVVFKNEDVFVKENSG